MERRLNADLTGDRPLVSVVVITWNSAQWLPRCLEGVRTQSWPRLELITIDNASADGSPELMAADSAIIVRNEGNRGFSAAANQGIARSRGAFVLLLNPDCLLGADYVERLVAALQAAGERFGAATGMLERAQGVSMTPTGTIDSLGITMTRSGRHLDLGQGLPLSRAPQVLHDAAPAKGGAFASGLYEVFGVSGAAGMYRRAFLDDVAVAGEIFDEDFFAYREDADLAWRGRILGWRALCDPAAIAHHVRRVTPAARESLPAEINMHSVKNRFLLRLKNEGPWLAARNAPFELTRDLLVLGAALTRERTSLPALGWIRRNLRRVLEKRKAIQRRRVVSDRQLAGWFR